MKINIEVTDTFGGDLNYSWVERSEIDVPDNATDRQIARAVKDAAGYTGVRCTVDNYGDEFRWNVQGACIAIIASVEFD